jgi:hypothetical protein
LRFRCLYAHTHSPLVLVWRSSIVNSYSPSDNGGALSSISPRVPFAEDDALHRSVSAIPRWFALRTMSRHEIRVYERLLDREVDAFLPLYRSNRKWKKRRPVVLDLPLFPGYLFVRVAPEERGRVIRIPGVLSLVGSRHEAWPIDKTTMELLRSGLDVRKAQPCPHLAIGKTSPNCERSA